MNYYRLTILACLTGLILIGLSVTPVQGQSGRRQTKPPPAAPVPSPTPEPTPTKKPEKEPELIFLVASDRNNVDIPFTFYDAAQRGCADRLRRASSADVDIVLKHMSRGEAIEKAKSESKTYVVHFTLGFDSMSNRYDLQLDYVVFEPMTARVVLTGRSYPNSQRKGPLIVGPTSRLPGGLYAERWLRDAGEEAAERILKKLSLGTPPN